MTAQETRGEPALVRRLPGLAHWPGPHNVRLEGEELVFEWVNADPTVEARRIQPGPRMLGQFANLCQAPAARILNYASRWGALGLRDGVPGGSGMVRRESIEDWRRWAREARAIMEIAAAIHNDESPPGQAVAVLERVDGRSWPIKPREKKPLPTRDEAARILLSLRAANEADLARYWIQLYKDTRDRPKARPNRRTASAKVDADAVEWVLRTHSHLRDLLDVRPDSFAMKTNLAAHVNRWINLGHVSLELSWGIRDESPVYGLYAPGLFGAVALLLAGAVNRSDNQATCSICEGEYTPRRKPAKGKRNFCDGCRDAGVPGKLAARTYREKKKREREPD